MGYSRNLAFHGQWGLIPGETANSATSPLNVTLISLGTFVTRQPAVGVGLVLMASLAAAGWWSAQLGRLLGLSRLFPAIVVALLATSPLLVSTVGLEAYLGVALLVGLVRYGAEARWLPAGLVTGLPDHRRASERRRRCPPRRAGPGRPGRRQRRGGRSRSRRVVAPEWHTRRRRHFP